MAAAAAGRALGQPLAATLGPYASVVALGARAWAIGTGDHGDDHGSGKEGGEGGGEEGSGAWGLGKELGASWLLAGGTGHGGPSFEAAFKVRTTA